MSKLAQKIRTSPVHRVATARTTGTLLSVPDSDVRAGFCLRHSGVGGCHGGTFRHSARVGSLGGFSPTGLVRRASRAWWLAAELRRLGGELVAIATGMWCDEWRRCVRR